MALGRIGPTQAYLTALGSLPIKEPLVTGAVGDWYAAVSVFISAGNYISAGLQLGFPVPIQLPRKPSFFMQFNSNGCVIYASELDQAHWSPTQLFVRARSGSSDLVSTTATFLVA